MKIQSVRKGALIALCCIAVMAFFSCQPEPEDTETYSVKYDANGATVGSVPVDKKKYDTGDTATILACSSNLIKNSGSFAYCWNTSPDGTGLTYLPGETLQVKKDIKLYALWGTRSFFAPDFTTNSDYYQTIAQLLKTGTYCEIWVEFGTGISNDTVNAITKEYDEKIHTQIINSFGAPYDVNHDGKTMLLLLDIKDGYSKANPTYVAGLFDTTQLYLNDTNHPGSNEADMIFIDVYPLSPGSDVFYTTIAHEFQHLINYSNTALGASTNKSEQDLWINEGLSSAAEYVYSGIPDANRIKWYNDDKLGTIAQGNNFFVWYGSWESVKPDSILDDYATVSLFFQWLRIHATNGTGIYKEILASPNRNYLAVTTTAANRINSSFGDWATLLESWHLANIFGTPDTLYGYKGSINVQMGGFDSSDNVARSLYPGEAILSGMPTGNTNNPSLKGVSGENIVYLGLNGTEYNIESTSNGTVAYTGDYSVVFNKKAISDSDYVNAETGFVASVSKISNYRSLQGASMRSMVVDTLPEAMPIDVCLTTRTRSSKEAQDVLKAIAGNKD